MEHQVERQGRVMAKAPSKVVRVLGVLTGLLFVVVAPMAALDAGSVSVGDVGFLLLAWALGLLFIGYGILGRTDWVKVPLGQTMFWNVVLGAAFIALGLS